MMSDLSLARFQGRMHLIILKACFVLRPDCLGPRFCRVPLFRGDVRPNNTWQYWCLTPLLVPYAAGLRRACRPGEDRPDPALP